ncbi:hypothetical protein ACO0LO_07525 [Undibacterium sp. TJN25]|uniref:hypothetical protein n=1 Tax=Undibacterium sp. TJN25 TaxID=3413056 RepID=UPI003BF0087B
MKTANTFKTGVIAATALVAAIVVAVSASGCAYQATTSQQANAGVQTVTVTAKRMSTEEKIAYDTANTTAQTVVMVAKRLTAEQKLAMAQQDIVQASAAHRSQPSA